MSQAPGAAGAPRAAALEDRLFVTLGTDAFECAPDSPGGWCLHPDALVALRGTRCAELRLDLLPGAEALGAGDIGALVAELRRMLPSTPVLAACHDAAGAGGRADLADEQRLTLLAAAVLSGVDHVDLDVGLVERMAADAAAAPLLEQVLAGPADVVLSSHPELPPGEPVPALLDAELARLLEVTGGAPSAAGVKLVPRVARADEALELLVHLPQLAGIWRARGLAGACFAAGADGVLSRILAPVRGSGFHYAAAPTPAGTGVPGQLDVDELLAAWGAWAPPAEGTPVFAVLGHPVAGSLSPELFTRLFAATGTEAMFVRLDLADAELAFRVAADLGLAGLSVTAPHKAAARRVARNSLAPELRTIGAANTLVATDDPPGWHGANTDLVGVRAALAELLEVDTDEALTAALAAAPERPVVVLGAGGAARAVVAALRALSAEHPLVVLAREPRKALALAREFGAAFGGLDELDGLAPLVLVHATTAGSPASPTGAAWVPGPGPLADLSRRAPDCRVLDANYRPRPTALVDAARVLGLRASGGMTWFLAQAAAQLEAFTGEPLEAALGVDRRVALAFAAAELDDALARQEDPDGRLADLSRTWTVLVGPRGVGKTAVTRLLMEQHGQAAADLDELLLVGRLEDHAGQVLAELGEARFRALELAALEGLLSEGSPLARQVARPRVLALGGGAVETARVRALLAGCTVVWLQASPEVLAARLADDPTPRPPVAAAAGAADPLTAARALAAARDALYAEVADHRLDTEGLDAAAVAERLVALLGR